MSLTLLLTSEGRVFGWGENAYGRIPGGAAYHEGDQDFLDTPVDLTDAFDSKIIDIGLQHAIGENGEVYQWGEQQTWSGFLTNFDYDDDVVEISESLAFDPGEYVERVSGSEPFLVTNEGNYVLPAYNQNEPNTIMGTEVLNDALPLEDNETIIAYRGALTHSVVLSSEGRLFTWGSDQHSYGVLGNGLTEENPFRFDEPFDDDFILTLDLHEDESIVDVKAMHYHNILITSEDRIFVWGNNTHNQLGTADENPILVPTERLFD